MFWRLKSCPMLCVGSFEKATGCILEKAPFRLDWLLGQDGLKEMPVCFLKGLRPTSSILSPLVVQLTWGHDNKQSPHRPTSALSFCLRMSLGKQSSEEKPKSHGLSHGRYKPHSPFFSFIMEPLVLSANGLVVVCEAQWNDDEFRFTDCESRTHPYG